MLKRLEDWWVERQPFNLLMYLNMIDIIGPRKMRLFMCGCCRSIWELLPNEQCRQIVEAGERYADGLIAEPERASLFGMRDSAGLGLDPQSRSYHAFRSTWHVLNPQFHSLAVGISCTRSTRLACEPEDVLAMEEGQSDLVRDLFDVPGQAEIFDRDWLGPDAVDLARHIVEDRDFGLVPILGDALEEAGCPSRRILDHCRAPKPHARGCWVLDGVLGRGGLSKSPAD